MKKILMLTCFLFLSITGAFAQLENPVSWAYFAKKTSKTEATIYLKATMAGKWHIYSMNVKGGPTKTSFTFSPSKDFTLIGKVIEPKPTEKYEKVLNVNLTYFEHEVVFQQKVKLNKATTVIKGKVEFMVCNDKHCLPADEVAFSIPVK